MKPTKFYLLLVVFISGMTTLGVEISASRLLDPFFGNSLVVWASIIGLMLLYLTVGYYIGGRWGRQRPSPQYAVSNYGLGGVSGGFGAIHCPPSSRVVGTGAGPIQCRDSGRIVCRGFNFVLRTHYAAGHRFALFHPAIAQRCGARRQYGRLSLWRSVRWAVCWEHFCQCLFSSQTSAPD